MKDLDQRLAALGRVKTDHDLKGLEDAVWARVDARGRSFPPMPRRAAAALCLATAMAASIAGAAAAASTRFPAETGAFAIAAPFAPSTALGG